MNFIARQGRRRLQYVTLTRFYFSNRYEPVSIYYHLHLRNKHITTNLFYGVVSLNRANLLAGSYRSICSAERRLCACCNASMRFDDITERRRVK